MARMPNRHVYLHETITIVGTGSEAYKAHTGKLGTARGDGGAPLLGTWQQSGSTGSWPTVVNLWEMRDWDHWAEILARQYTRSSGQEPELKQWWTEATQWRSGGFDRILVPAGFSPTRREIVARGIHGVGCLQEIATVKPGAAERLLAALATRWRRVMAGRGIELLGAYRTAMRDTEVVLLWNLPTFAHFTSYLREAEGKAARAWRKTARTWCVDRRETLLVPSPWCVHHPDWRANAS
jgi:hypothetical protein